MHIPNLLLLISNNKLDDWFIAFVPFPINIWLLFKFDVPIPPRETVNIPDVILEAFIEVKPEPFKDKVPVVILEALNLLMKRQNLKK